MFNLPPVTRALLVANVLIFVLQQLGGDYLTARYALWPLDDSQTLRLPQGGALAIGFHVWQIVTYAFLHGSFGHIAFNMFALWTFGGPVENALGARKYTLYYFVCVIGAALAQLAVLHFFSPEAFYPTVGASGGVFGLLLAFALLYPGARIALLFFPLPIPATIAVIGYLVIEFLLGVTGMQQSVAHFAHLGGALAGFLLLRFWLAGARGGRH